VDTKIRERPKNVPVVRLLNQKMFNLSSPPKKNSSKMKKPLPELKLGRTFTVPTAARATRLTPLPAPNVVAIYLKEPAVPKVRLLARTVVRLPPMWPVNIAAQ
jgi:hypothetical protein